MSPATRRQRGAFASACGEKSDSELQGGEAPVQDLAIVCAVQIYWSFRTVVNDVRGPYSGSRDLASYIKENDLTESTIFGVHFRMK